MLQTPACNAVWDAFANPYLACAAEADQIGVLMDDLSDDIWADRSDLPVQPALSVLAEDAVLAALAQLHARYWESEAAALPWLLRPATRFGLLGPRRSSSIRIPFEQQLTRGWQAALSAVPARVGRLLTTPPQSLARRYAVLPRTLVHGDTKVPNFALLPDGRVAAIDWALVGVGPSTLDLGWYLAINGGRLARSRDAVIARYRELLEAELRTSLSTEIWTQMVGIGVLTGALLLLWEKALQLEAGLDPRVEAEWHWWVDALAGLC